MKALLLIDIQNDFLPGGALAVPEGDKIISIVNDLQPLFELVVATQDWHPQGHKSFASSHAGKKPFQTINLHGFEQVLWPDHCLQGSTGAEFSAQLNLNKVDTIFRKGTNPEIDSYSSFYDNGHLKSTGLTDYLNGKGIHQVYLAGLAGDYCVYYSALDAVQENFETYIVEDATRSIDEKGFEQAKGEVLKKGGKLVQSRELVKLFKR